MMTSPGAIRTDPFPPDDDDRIRIYGSTSAERPFKAKKKPENSESLTASTSDVQFEDDEQTESLISSSGSVSYKSRKSYVGSGLSIDRTEDTVSVISSSKSVRYSWWKHPKVRDNYRVVVGAIVLTVIGLILILTGVAIMLSSFRGWHSLVFFIGGCLFLIPGLYHVIIIYLAATGRGGYTFHNISVFS